jgi:hypothetical protein
MVFAVGIGFLARDPELAIWVFLSYACMLIIGEACLLLLTGGPVLHQREVDLIKEWCGISSNARNTVIFLTGILTGYLYFASRGASVDIFLLTIGILLFASSFCLVELTCFLQALLKWKKRSTWVGYWVIVITALIVTAVVSRNLARYFGLPFINDAIAVFVPFFASNLLRFVAVRDVINRPVFKSLDQVAKYINLSGTGSRSQTESLEMRGLLEQHLASIQAIGRGAQTLQEIHDRAIELFNSLMSNRAKVLSEKSLCIPETAWQPSQRLKITRRRILLSGELVLCADVAEEGVITKFLIQTTSRASNYSDTQIHDLALTSAILENERSLTLRARGLMFLESLAPALLHGTMDRWVRQQAAQWLNTEDSREAQQLKMWIELHLSVLELREINRTAHYGARIRDDIIKRILQVPSTGLSREYISCMNLLLEIRKMEQQVWDRRIEICKLLSVPIGRKDTYGIELAQLERSVEALRDSVNRRRLVAKFITTKENSQCLLPDN